ncbi:hypothetical protein Pcinc_014795 [Petrolisthes cinctipes]|uniref:Uncharacterized protein n=1 Tax=Petrolisthes cinctipes TaxID=88211 RepID=A0AAE1KSW9_PETCI|nr:hypothetical protein Pcinc_014795 [Petrolisthes cinctipes]
MHSPIIIPLTHQHHPPSIPTHSPITIPLTHQHHHPSPPTHLPITIPLTHQHHHPSPPTHPSPYLSPTNTTITPHSPTHHRHTSHPKLSPSLLTMTTKTTPNYVLPLKPRRNTFYTYHQSTNTTPTESTHYTTKVYQVHVVSVCEGTRCVDITIPDVDTIIPDVDIATPGVNTTTPGVDITTPGVDITTPGVDTGGDSALTLAGLSMSSK